jgi:HEAT repeat protein
VRTCSHSLVILVLLAPGVLSQQASVGRFASFKQLLRERNIELTETSLVAALQNEDAHVRYLAALVLAENQSTNAISAITVALAQEKVPETRVNLALALAQLGDPKGIQTLRETCDNAGADLRSRVYATKYVVDLGQKGCLNAAIDASRSATTDSGSRVLALSLLPRFRHPTAADSERVFDASVKALSDPQAEVRVAAGDTLRRLGKPSGVSSLQQAIAREQDDVVRSKLRLDLEELKEKEQH